MCPECARLRLVWYSTARRLPVEKQPDADQMLVICEDKDSQPYQQALKALRDHQANCPECKKERVE